MYLLSGKDTGDIINKVNTYLKSKDQEVWRHEEDIRSCLMVGYHLFGLSCSSFLLLCLSGVFLVRW